MPCPWLYTGGFLRGPSLTSAATQRAVARASAPGISRLRHAATPGDGSRAGAARGGWLCHRRAAAEDRAWTCPRVWPTEQGGTAKEGEALPARCGGCAAARLYSLPRAPAQPRSSSWLAGGAAGCQPGRGESPAPRARAPGQPHSLSSLVWM